MPPVATIFFLAVLALIMYSPSVLAEEKAPTFKDGFFQVDIIREGNNIREYGSIVDFIVAILQVLTVMIAIIAVAAMIWGGVMYITSGGDEGKAETGKKVVLYAIIGLIIIGAAGAVVNVFINIIRS